MEKMGRGGTEGAGRGESQNPQRQSRRVRRLFAAFGCLGCWSLLFGILTAVALLSSCGASERGWIGGEENRREGKSTELEAYALTDALGASAGSSADRPDGSVQTDSLPQPDAPAQTDPPPQPDAPAQTDSPDPSPTPPPIAVELLSQMTAFEKICQLFVVFPTAVTGTRTATIAGEATRAGLAHYPVGGFLYDRGNLRTQEQVRAMLDGTQSMSRIPLLLTCDEEGGRVSRLMSTVGTPAVGPMLGYEAQGAEKAAENAEIIAGGLISCGFNMDLAPVADVWSNPSNTVIGNRAYSRDYAAAAELVAAAVEGFHTGGVACTLKHFPGHGDTAEDSHTGAAFLYKTLDALRNEEFLPFRAGIAAGADAVMIGHLTVPEVDSAPAPFSYRIVTELLRKELGFDGVILTDSLQMQAVSTRYNSGDMAVHALEAGVDMLLCPPSLEDAVAGLEQALEDGTLSESRLDESVLRILSLKEARGLLKK